MIKRQVTAVVKEIEDSMNTQTKRNRSDYNESERRHETRILLSSNDFGKTIGKGGQMIQSIRQKSGVNMRGANLNDNDRIVHLSGNFRQVLEGFDLITELLYNNQEKVSITMLIEDDKAGRVIGPKGAIILGLKTKSGAINVKMLKDPFEFEEGGAEKNKLFLRTLNIEGSLSAVRRTHYMILELFSYPTEVIPMPAYDAPQPGLPFGGPPLAGGGMPPAPNDPSWRGQSPGIPALAPLPLSLLPNLGVHPDVVKQIGDLRNFFHTYGLDLVVVEMNRSPQAALAVQPAVGNIPGPNGNPYPNVNYGYHQSQTADQYITNNSASGNNLHSGYNHDSRHNNHGHGHNLDGPGQVPDSTHKLDFLIPKAKVGSVIGKGASNLKSLQKEFEVFIRVDRYESHGMRKVILRGENKFSLERAKERILAVVQNSGGEGLLNEEDEDGGGGGGAAEESNLSGDYEMGT